MHTENSPFHTLFERAVRRVMAFDYAKFIMKFINVWLSSLINVDH